MIFISLVYLNTLLSVIFYLGFYTNGYFSFLPLLLYFILKFLLGVPHSVVKPDIPGISEVIRLEHGSVANAVGAAIAQVSGEVDQVFSGLGREEALERASGIARDRAIAAGADRDHLRVVDLEDLPLAYLPGDARRVRVKVVGETVSS